MAPLPEKQHSSNTEETNKLPTSHIDDNKVVITGMAGLYPQSRYVKDLENILYNKINPVSSENKRWNYKHPEVSQFTGDIPDLQLFDAQFFKVHYVLSKNMDSMARKVLEVAYEAIYDAGVSPKYLDGKKLGVYIGSSFSETEKTFYCAAAHRDGFGITGCSKSMFANRISYWLNAKGPSMTLDQAGTGSTAALEQAYMDITTGKCEAAIVGGTQICLHPQLLFHFNRMAKTSMDGKTKSFSQNADGFAVSEAINVLFLQKAKDALRIYAEVVHVKNSFMSLLPGKISPKYGYNRDPADTANFLKKFYKDAGVSPNVVEYVEAVGSAVPDADKSELEAFDNVFCKNRKEPLFVGSVMSNIGNGDVASGISAITKVLLGYQRGELAANLHYDAPRTDIDAVREGRIKVVDEHQRFNRTYTAINSMSFNGVNTHVLLKGHYKPKDPNRYKSNLPYLVTISGRQDTSVQRVLDILKSKPIDPEELALLHNSHELVTTGHLGRGFIILNTNQEQQTVSLSEQAEYFDEIQHPLWFVYSGMGSQWPGMGVPFMRIPAFAAAVERCHKALQPKGIDLIHIITTPDKTIFDNILHAFVGISAVQIGLTAVLLELGLIPNKIIGHSFGELGCAYADGCMTAEEVILSSYSRGLVSLETPFIRGSMAAVAMGYQQISMICPPEIEIACHNSAESSTISGPADVMNEFMAALTAKGIFVREVPCSNIAYHSRYVSDAGPGLLTYLRKEIQTPKTRSDRWVSTSVPYHMWDEPNAKYCSAEYMTNNFLSPVLFEEACKLIPSNAVLLEVAPHALMQAILKRSLPQSCTYIPLTRRGHTDNVLMLLEALGKLYMEGYNPKVRKLYPKIEFPVSTGTPLLSHLVEWSHQEIWSYPAYQSAIKKVAASCKFVVSLYEEEFYYLKGHVIREKNLLPFSFALIAAWDTLAMSMNLPRKSIDVQYHDVRFYAQPILYEQKTVKLSVAIHRGNGWFEVKNENSKVLTGFITSEKIEVKDDETTSTTPSTDFELNAQDIYRLLYLRGFAYSGEFRSLQSANDTLTEANLLWNDNWVTFIDGLLQLNNLKNDQYSISQPDHIRKMSINVEEHIKNIKANANRRPILKAEINDLFADCKSGGVTIENIQFRKLISPKDYDVTLKSLSFVPRFNSQFNVSVALQIFFQVVAENLNKDIIRAASFKTDVENNELLYEINKIADEPNIPNLQIIHETCANDKINSDVLIVRNLSINDEICHTLYQSLPSNSFIINEEDISGELTTIRPSGLYKKISIIKNSRTQLELVRWRPNNSSTGSYSAFTVNSELDIALLSSTRNSLPPRNSLLVLSSYPPILELVNEVMKWRKESARNSVSVLMINKNSREKVDELPDNDLAFNIFENGLWGGEYYVPVTQSVGAESKVSLQNNQCGSIESVHWTQAHETTSGIPLTVHYTGLLIDDLRRAQGIVSGIENGFGMEFSGLTNSGEKVMGLIRNGAASSHVMACPDVLWPVPPYWTLEDAATIPFAYVYAYYCLEIKSANRLIRKNLTQTRLLIHGGAGALGQAMISIALAKRFRVFATVGSIQKKIFLMRLFPELNEDDIITSRDPSFGEYIINATSGEGCDIICCLKEELKDVAMSCCGPIGLIFDTVQLPNHSHYVFGMNYLNKERSYFAVDITSLFRPSENAMLKKVHWLVSEGIACGAVRPLTRVSFPAAESAHAFRLLASSQHCSRVLLSLNQVLPLPLPRFSSTEGYCHLVLADTQPLGLETVNKLVQRGIKKLHIHLRKPVPYFLCKLRLWKASNVQVALSYGELDELNEVYNLISEATVMGPIEGIYVAAEEFSRESVINNLDAASKKLELKSLKHFLIIAKDIYCAINAVVSRRRAGLPATLIDLSLAEKWIDADGFVWYRGAIEAAEKALSSKDSVLSVQTIWTSRLSLIQKIASLTGTKLDIQTFRDKENILNLKDLGIRNENLKAVYTLLSDEYNTALEEEDIPSLTIEKINEIEKPVLETEYEEAKGFDALFSYVDPDEISASNELVQMPTLADNCTLRGDEFDVNETHLMCIIPGVEGHHRRFQKLWENLRLPVLVLQPGLDDPNETIEDMALKYFRILERKNCVKNDFYFLGYETGVMVAIELAALFEEKGFTGTVFFLGDGPEETKEYIEELLLQFDSESSLQAELVRHMSALMGAERAPVSSEEDSVKCGWNERVESCVRSMLGCVSHSAQYARALLEAAYARIRSARRYDATRRALRSQVVLLRGRRSRPDLSCSVQVQKTYLLPTPMHAITTDLRVPALINRHLSTDIKEAYFNKNINDTYLANGLDFVNSKTEK